MPVAPESFGGTLRRFRLSAGLSQERLAELAAVSTEAVGALERGARTAPQRQTLELLIGALHLGEADRAALTLAAVRPSKPRLRSPRAEQTSDASLAIPRSELTSFVGRDAEVDALLRATKSARLTTIVGPGGVGKSRLALEVARIAASRFEGAVVIGLAPLMPRSPVLPAFAKAFGVHDSGPMDLEQQLVAALGDRSLLVILDNCEHVLDALDAPLERLLLSCSGLRVLATSRERLAIGGERIVRLAPLAITHAVDVFIDRVAANGFDPGENSEDLRLAADICERLDRMPLAIELAAACADVYALDGLARRLREGAALPARPKRNALPQHRSLQALVEWSHDALDASEAAVFRRLALFHGGCRQDDAQRILVDANLSGDDVLHALFRLHERSLIDADRADVPRFQMLQTIRDFADGRLDAAERTHTSTAFAAHYLAIVAEQGATLRGPRQDEAIDRIGAEMMNVRAALALFTPQAPFALTALGALGSLSHYWLRTGGLSEASDIFAKIDFERFEPSIPLAAALSGAAFVELNRQSFGAAFAYASRARSAADAVGDEWYAICAANAQHAAAARLPGEASLDEPFADIYARAQQLGDPWLTGSAALRMAALTDRDRRVTRIGFLEFGLACARSSGDAFGVQAMSFVLAAATAQTEPHRSAEYVYDVWDTLRSSHVFGRARCVESLTEVAERLERLDEAAFFTGAALSLSRRSGLTESSLTWLHAARMRLEPQHHEAFEAGTNATEAATAARVSSFKDWLESSRPASYQSR